VIRSSPWTKADVVAHYGPVAEAMLPHLAARPLTLVRHRTNVEDKGFFQKNSPAHFPAFIPRIEVPKADGVNHHASVDSREGLEYLANQGAVELHVALATAPALDRPDRLVIDLDPHSDDPAQVRVAARRVRALLDELEIDSVPVASGGKGYHVYIALVPTAEIDRRRLARSAHPRQRARASLPRRAHHRDPEEEPQGTGVRRLGSPSPPSPTDSARPLRCSSSHTIRSMPRRCAPAPMRCATSSHSSSSATTASVARCRCRDLSARDRRHRARWHRC